MYDRKTINRVLRLLKLYEDQITKVVRETDIKVRTITEWKKKSAPFLARNMEQAIKKGAKKSR